MDTKKLKEAITKDRVYTCRLCGKRITMKKDDNCQHDFLLTDN
jgi:DNA-directed RNA polymerase subunit RPC12/RpoP